MTTRQRVSKRAAAKESMTPPSPPTKLQKEIIHWVRRNVPTKKTKFLHSHVVEYFIASKAVDALVNDSPWSKEKAKENSEIVFEFRETAVNFMDEMLKHKMFHRAKKIPVQDKSKKKKKKSDEKTDTEKEDQESKTPKPEKERKKRKIRLDMHLEQVFLDCTDAYVWVYDPTSWFYWVGGGLIVLGIIAICLFPLWPSYMRKGVHYLSIGAAGFLIFIILLGVLKYIIFALLFVLTTGKLKFWFFPNLTEDVGFFESFLPIYDYTYTKKDKDSDDEEEDDEEENEEENKNDADNSESDESTSKKSSTGKDFEMVDEKDAVQGD